VGAKMFQNQFRPIIVTTSTIFLGEGDRTGRGGTELAGPVLGIFIWVGQSKAKQILGRLTGVVYMGIMGMISAVWVGQERVW